MFSSVNAMEYHDDDFLYYQSQCAPYGVIQKKPPQNNALNEDFYLCNTPSNPGMYNIYRIKKQHFEKVRGTGTNETLDGPGCLIIATKSLGFELNPDLAYKDNAANRLESNGKKHVKTHVALVRQKSHLPTTIIYEIYSGREVCGKLSIGSEESHNIWVDNINIIEEYQNKGIGLAALLAFLEFVDMNPQIYPQAQEYFLRDAVTICKKKVEGVYESLGFCKIPGTGNAYIRKRKK